MYLQSDNPALQASAVEQCRNFDQKSSLFRYTQAELDSVVLHINNGDPIVRLESSIMYIYSTW
jgi:hypothetical protein